MTDSRNFADDNTQTRSQQLEKRMLDFAVAVIKQLQSHPQIPEPVINQLIRSSTSVGTNYAEACNAVSKLDFRNKIYISKKEAAESRYWLDLCIALTQKSDSWGTLRQEAHELLMILQTIVNTLKEKSEK